MATLAEIEYMKSRFGLAVAVLVLSCFVVGVCCLDHNGSQVKQGELFGSTAFKLVAGMVSVLVLAAAAIAGIYLSDTKWAQVAHYLSVTAMPVWRVFGWFSLVSGSLIVVLYIAVVAVQGGLLYQPGRHMHSDPLDYGMPFDLIRVHAPDGITTEAFYIHPTTNSQNKHLCILFCQGNGGNSADRLPMFKELRDRTGLAVLAPSYRGYGNSKGSASEAGIRQDMSALLKWHAEAHPLDKLVAVGESMGGGIAVDTVHNHPNLFAKLVVINSFTSLHDLVPEIFPIPKPLMSFMHHNKWASIDKIDKSLRQVDMLFVVGERDALINPNHGKRLHQKAIAVGCKAKLVTQPKAGHNDYSLKPVIDFINQ